MFFIIKEWVFFLEPISGYVVVQVELRYLLEKPDYRPSVLRPELFSNNRLNLCVGDRAQVES